MASHDCQNTTSCLPSCTATLSDRLKAHNIQALTACPKILTQRLVHVVGVPSWAFTIPWEERLVEFGGYKTWVREVGKKPGSGGGLFGLFGKNSDKSKG